jgi:hypothetical protein
MRDEATCFISHRFAASKQLTISGLLHAQNRGQTTMPLSSFLFDLRFFTMLSHCPGLLKKCTSDHLNVSVKGDSRESQEVGRQSEYCTNL